MTDKATFAAGCFWCAEAALKLLDGVETVTSGYAGGAVENPSYEEVSSGTTGHVEAVQVKYNPQKTSYNELLRVFWEIHNPKEENKQGPDIGPQYQAVVFYHNEEQKRIAEEGKRQIEEAMKEKVMTKIKPFTNFYPAEEYHTDYFERNPNTSYSQAVIKPKVEKVKKIIEEKK